MPTRIADLTVDEFRALMRETLSEAQRPATPPRSPLVAVVDLAAELGVEPRTVRQRCQRMGVPIRTAQGVPLANVRQSDRGRKHFVMRAEWEGGEKLHPTTVRNDLKRAAR